MNGSCATNASAASIERKIAMLPRSPNGPIPTTSPRSTNASTTALWRGYTAMISSIDAPDGSPITTYFIASAYGSSSGRAFDVGGRLRQTACVNGEVWYTERDGGHLAFTVFGEGAIDLAIPQNRFPIDLIWEWPHLATFMESLGRMARVITWDCRGFGASDTL